MLSLTRLPGVLIAALVISGCAPGVALRPGLAPLDHDSTGTVWGDEYEGLAVDGGETVRALPGGFRAEWAFGETRAGRFDAFARGVSIHARSYASGDVGAVSWRGTGVVREVMAGDVTPVIADGALVGDPRTGGDLRASGVGRMEGLTMRASASTWSSVRGGGLTLGAGSLRLSLGGWQAGNHSSDRAGATTIAWIMRGGTVGIAGAAAGARRRAISVYGARHTLSSFAGAELALSDHRMRAVIRMVAGDHNAWRAIAIAGAGPANDAPLVFARRERWGAALERRDAWGWGAARTGVSTLTRRDIVSDVRRRRVFLDGEWRMTDDTRLELAARVTREESDRNSGGPLAAAPTHDTTDDWRARVTLRAQRATENDWLCDHVYRIEWVQNRTGRPGMIASWAWRLRAGALDTRLSASAHALERGQVSYATDSSPPGMVEYSSVSGKGAALAASLRLWLKRHVWLGAAWSQTPPRASRVWITLGVRG